MIPLEELPGIGSELARRVRNTLGPDADSIVAADPYKLIKVWGIGWTKADAIARESYKVAADALKRLQAGIDEWFRQRAQDGNTAADFEEAIYGARELLDTSDSRSLPIAQTLADSGHWYYAGSMVAPWDLRRKEEYIARRLKELASGKFAGPCDGPELFSDQASALGIIQQSRVFALTGAPGVGKTATIKAVIRSNPDARIMLCAPTGKAAKRMEEMTGHDASTMHRALEPQVEGGKYGKRFHFTRDEHRPLSADLIIIDETSMVDTWLMFSFLKAVDEHTRLLLVGDPYQLPSVGAGNILGDIVRSGVIPNMELTQIKRTNPDLLIARNCARVKSGEPPVNEVGAKDWFFFERATPGQVAQTIVELVTEKLPAKFGADPMRDIQVITALNMRSELSRDALNQRLRAKLNRGAVESRPTTGDRVICTKNDYKLGVYNGDMGTVVDADVREITILFDDDPAPMRCRRSDIALDLAYALTVHKAQGSEWPLVVIPIHRVLGPMITRRAWLYTAISRARTATILVGSLGELAAIVGREQDTNRVTMLRGLLDGTDVNDSRGRPREETVQLPEQ